MLDDSILDKEVILGKYHSSASPNTEDNSFSNGGDEETTKQILKHDKSAAGILCQFKTLHGTRALKFDLSKDVIGIVATLGKVDDETLSRLLSEYLGVETMLTIVCKTREGIKALERYDKEGSIDKSAGLHGLGFSIGRILDRRFLAICLEDIRPYVGDFVTNDPQRRLDLIKPRLPNGQCVPGFLGFAVNMVNMDAAHQFCLTASGYGLRETLFYHLFSRTQVYSTRVDMLRALPFISGGAISLDGGMIRGPGIYSLGNREDVDVRFPVTSGMPSCPANYRKTENQMKDLEAKREKLLGDLRRERQKMDKAKLDFERKKQEFVVFLAQGSSYVTQIDGATGLGWLSRSTDKSFAGIRANSLTGTLTTLPDTAFSVNRPQGKRSRLPGTSPAASNEGPGPAEAGRGRGGVRQQCVHCTSEKTPLWRRGPLGPRTLCNACGLQYRLGRLVPESRPAASPTFLLNQQSNSHGKAPLSAGRPRNKRSRAAPSYVHSPASEGAGPTEAKGGGGGARRRCTHRATEKTPQWRAGPPGPETLRNPRRLRNKSGRPVPENSPAASPTLLLTRHSNSRGKAAPLSGSRPRNKRSEVEGGGGGARRRCMHCASETTPQWREGPSGPRTLCNACGVQYKLGQLVPEYRPAASPTFVPTRHSNLHRKVMELRRQKESRRRQNRRRSKARATSRSADVAISL
ncbi:hypothetical protein BT93_L4257 [Corymbia citriodora subsp. variegata]|nr:hypothetical protein BT93_L4257 [Corymbia citriodora subsp. variegata]